MRIAVLLSGGVDSSVTLRLLAEAGHEVEAFYLKIWLEDELAHLGACPWEEDLAYARAVCEAVGVPLNVLSLQRAYHDRVVRWAVDELRQGHTPSPDIFCNRRIKFGAFMEELEEARGHDFDRVASGHYARIDRNGETVRLLSGVDPVKDQTYFLFHLDRSQLERLEFPLGEYRKSEVRELARRFDLPNQNRPDSQGICFLGKLPYDEFVKGYLGENPGEIRELAEDGNSVGRLLGTHRGLWFHTIGQRKGLGLGGGPWYVVSKDLEKNVLYVGHGRVLPDLSRRSFRVKDPHWIAGQSPGVERLGIRIRHSPALVNGTVQAVDGGLEVLLDEADAGVAAGQWAVFYDGPVCLGGGMITGSSSVGNSTSDQSENASSRTES